MARRRLNAVQAANKLVGRNNWNRAVGIADLNRRRAAMVEIIQRHLTTLDAAFSMRLTYPPVSLTSDYKIELDALLPSVPPAGNQALIGDANLSWLVYMNSNGSVTTQQPSGTGQVTISVVPTELGKYSHIILERIGDDITLTVDSASAVLNKADWLPISPSRIGAAGSILTYSGIIANVKITDAGTLIRDYPVDETWIGPSTVLTDYSGNDQHGTAVNVDVDDSENFTFDGSASPNTWTNDDELRVLEVAGT